MNVIFLSLDLCHGMIYLVSYILSLLQTPPNGSVRPTFFNTLWYNVSLPSIQLYSCLVWSDCSGGHFVVIGARQVSIVLYCIATVRTSAEKYGAKYKTTHPLATLIDEKAFDRVNWVNVLEVLHCIGVDWKDRRLHTQQSSFVGVEDWE